MLIPSISHGMGLILLFGVNGIITRFLGLSNNIYGFHGIVFGSVLYSFPIAFLMLVDILNYEDGSPYEAADVLGIPKLSQFASISFPYIRKPLIAVVFATFTAVFTDYGVPLVVGGMYTTLPVLMYQEVIGLLNFNRGSVLGVILLMPAFIAFVLDILNRDKASSNFVVQKKTISNNAVRDKIAFIYIILICAIIVIPVIIFLFLTFTSNYPVDMSLTFDNIIRTMNMGVGRFLGTSLVVAVLVSLLGTAVSWLTAYFTARTRGRSSRVLHLFSVVSLAVPGIVLGLSYVLFFNGTILYGTIAVLILVNIAHFMASPYLMAYNSLGKLNANLEDVGHTLGIGRMRIIRDVIIPETRHTILEMFSYFFVNSMVTISAVAFLSNARNFPVSLVITRFEAQLFLEGTAFVSVIILICNIIIKVAASFVGKKLQASGSA
jgi:iron(III) transport system permease protein